MTFIRRHIVPVLLIIFGLLALVLLNYFAQTGQVGVNPFEFALKACGKIFYTGVAWIATHIIIKYFFPTVYDYCHRGDANMSSFESAWKSGTSWDWRIFTAVFTHVGIFIAICLLFALAF